MTINAIGIIPVKTDGCPRMGDYAIKKKMNVSWANKKVGDIVLFDFNHNGTSDHIGILEAINKDGTITTIEGNTGSGNDTNGGQVQRRQRYKSQVNYFIRPKYNKDVTAKMVLATARAELGTKEKPAGTNKVKYNVWFYGKNLSAFWCCTFICWLFAHVREPEVIPIVKKPTGKYSGEIPTGLIRKGVKGNKVKQLQLFLNWYHPEWKLKPDKDCGPKTEAAIKSFQKTEGLDPDGEYGKKSYKKASVYKAKATATTKPKSATLAKKPAVKTPATKPELAVAWARKIAKSGKYGYKKWNNKKKKTKLCPICHPGTGNGWNCIGFVSACWFHGAGLKTIECSCKGIGTDSFFTKVSLNSWRQRNGKDWDMIKVGAKNGKDIPASKLKPGDILICYDGNGKFHHVVLYTGHEMYIDCTNTSKKHIAVREYKNLCKRYHVTRAFRYTGK